MRLVVGACGAALFAVGVLLACTGEDPSPPSTIILDGAPDDRTVSSLLDGGGSSDSSAPAEAASGALQLQCALQNQPPPRPMGYAGADAGGGHGTFDSERFVMVPLHDGLNVAAIGIVQGGAQGSAGDLYVWTIPYDTGDPGMHQVGPITLPGRRIAWVGRTTDGVGALVVEDQPFDPDAGGSGGYQYRVYKLTDNDLLKNPSVTTTTGVSLPAVVSDPAYNEVTAATVVPLDVDDYFVIANADISGTQSDRLVTARVRPSGVSVQAPTHVGSVFTRNPAIAQGSALQVFLAAGGQASLGPSRETFNLDTAAPIGSPVAMDDFLMASEPVTGGTAMMFADGLPGTQKTTQYRMGIVASAAAVDPSSLALAQIDGTSLDFFQAPNGRFWTYPNSPPAFVAAAQRSDGAGVGFYILGIDGAAIANQPADGPNALLQDVKAPDAVVGTSSFSAQPPAPDAVFPFVWIVRSAGTDTAYYSRVVCR